MRALLVLLSANLLFTASCGSKGTQTPERYTRAERFDRNGIHVVKLVGTPFEMGLQHGELMAPELAEGVTFVEEDPLFSLLLPLARSQGMVEDALAYSYPEVYEECRGMSEAARRAGVKGWTLEICITLAYGDVVLAFIADLLDTGCTQFMATGTATADGRLIHGRNMDWDRLSYLVNHPTVIVRQPTDGLASMSMGFPGCVAPYNGINEAGLAVATNDNAANPDLDPNQRGRPGHTQMVHQLLAHASSLDQAEAYLESQEHARATIIGVSDGDHQTAAVFEVTPSHMAVRRLDPNGLAYATNHFVDPLTDPLDTRPSTPEAGTVCRFNRLEELLPPEGRETHFGQVDKIVAKAVLADRYDACTGETYPVDTFDLDGGIGANGTIWSMVFLPEDRQVYFAGGEPPVVQQPFVGFDLYDLLLEGGDGATDPADLPAP